MKIARLLIPGNFEDAYIYMGRLILVTEDLSFQHYSIDSIVNRLEQDSTNIPAARYMFARNDWLASEQFRLLMQRQEIALAFAKTIDNMSHPIDIEDSAELIGEQDIPVKMGALLDITIYRRRMYIGADLGFYDLEIDWEDEHLPIKKTRKRLDTHCYAVSTSYGTANASCGDDGLFSFYDDFSTLDKINISSDQNFEQTAATSLRSSWLEDDLINYTGQNRPSLLKADISKLDKPTAGERKVVTHLKNNGEEMGFLFSGLNDKYHIKPDDVNFIWNSSRTLFVQTRSNEFYTAGILRDGNHLSLRYTKQYVGDSNRILGATIVKSGKHSCLVAEYYNRVALLGHKEWHTIVEGQSLSVRTFPGSKRYKNLVVITLDYGILIASILDDTDWKF